jgi:hypothetical protein
MRRKPRLRLTVAGAMLLAAIAAIILNQFRPTNRDEAVRIATEYVRREEPGFRPDDCTIRAEELGSEGDWSVIFGRDGVIWYWVRVKKNGEANRWEVEQGTR